MKLPTVPIIVAVVIVAAVGGLYFSGFELDISSDAMEETETGDAMEESEGSIATGAEVARDALKVFDENMKAGDGYENYLVYGESGEVVLRSSEDEGNTFFGDVNQDAFLTGMLYLAYRELGDSEAAGAEFENLYSACSDNGLCGGMVYSSVYREWQDTGDETYRDALISASPAVFDLESETSTQIEFSVQSLGMSYSLKGDESISNQIDSQFADYEEFTQQIMSQEGITSETGFFLTCQTSRAISSLYEFEGQEPDNIFYPNLMVLYDEIVGDFGAPGQLELNTVVDCGHALVNAYEATSNVTYKDAAASLLSFSVNGYPEFTDFQSGSELELEFNSVEASNIHSALNIIDVAFLAARLADSGVAE